MPPTLDLASCIQTFNLVSNKQHKVIQGMLNKIIDLISGKEHYKIKLKVVFKDGQVRGHYQICDRFLREVYATYIINPIDDTDYHYVLYGALQSLLYLKGVKEYKQYTKVNSGTLVSDAIKTLLDNNVKTTFIISNS